MKNLIVTMTRGPNPDDLELNSPLGKALDQHLVAQNFDQMLTNLSILIGDDFDWLIGDFDSFADSVAKDVQNGKLTNETLLNTCSHASVSDASPNDQLKQLIPPMLYWLAARDEYHLGNVEAAWSLLYACKYRTDVALQSMHHPDCKPSAYMQQRHIASLGGQAKGSNNQPAKDEVLQLIRRKRPRKGWVGAVNAVEEIIPELMEFLARRRGVQLKSTPDNLKANIRNWRKHEPFKTDFQNALDGK